MGRAWRSQGMANPFDSEQFEEGFTAGYADQFADEADFSSCPYPEGSAEAERWHEGYREGGWE